MKNFKNNIANISLVCLTVLMFFLVAINWSLSLNIGLANLAQKDSIYNFFRGNSISTTNQSISFEKPQIIAINNNNQTYTSYFNRLQTTKLYEDIFPFLSLYINEDALKSSSKLEYNQAIMKNNAIYLEYNTLLCSLLDTQSNIYVSSLIISDDYIYILSHNSYYKVEISQNLSLSYDYTTLDNMFYFKNTGNDTINLVSSDNFNGSELTFTNAILNQDINDKIVANFLYNPEITSNYSPNDIETVYVNEFSNTTITDKSIEFATTDQRGNIKYSDEDLSNTFMSNQSCLLYNNIMSQIGSKALAKVYDLYKKDNQTIVVVTGVIDQIPLEFNDFYAVFSYTNNSLSYAKINFKVVNPTLKRVKTIKSNSIQSDQKIGLIYDKEGNLDYKEIYFEG